jgi:hypothetical protein
LTDMTAPTIMKSLSRFIRPSYKLQVEIIG